MYARNTLPYEFVCDSFLLSCPVGYCVVVVKTATGRGGKTSYPLKKEDARVGERNMKTVFTISTFEEMC
jgi:hypothetical protein